MFFKVHKPSNLSVIFLPKFHQTFFSRDLLRLSLVRNHLTEVPSDALIILKNLNQLDLTDNKISSLHRGVFEGIAMILL